MSNGISARLVRQKTYSINKLNQVKYNVLDSSKKYGISMEQPTYSIDLVPGIHRAVSYSIRYRPIGQLEWILLRGWWNDNGIWTEDGIFIDG